MKYKFVDFIIKRLMNMGFDADHIGSMFCIFHKKR